MNRIHIGDAVAWTTVITGVAFLAIVGPVYADVSSPLNIRNLSPPVASYGLPLWGVRATERRAEFSVTTEIANHFVLAGQRREELLLDGETWRVGVNYSRRLGKAWSVSVHVPWYRHSGGFLDDIVDGWHGLFDLPDGNRNLRGEDQLRYLYTDGGARRYVFEHGSSGLGDMQIGVSRNFGAERGFALNAALKVPSGKRDALTGTGAADLSLSVLKRGGWAIAGAPAGVYWGAGVLRPGATELFELRSADWVVFGVLGGGWQPLPRLGFKAQLDAHSKFYESGLDEMGGNSVQASVGGWWEADSGPTVTVAVSEDLIVKGSPDFAIHLALGWRF